MGAPSLRALVALAVLAAASGAAAQAPAPELKLPRADFAMGEIVPVELVVQAQAGTGIGNVDIPGLAEFQVHSGPDVAMSMQIDMSRGVSTAVHSYRWQIAPKRPGSFFLGPATVMVDGRALRSNRVALKVTAEPRSGGVDAADSQIFVTATVDKPRAIAGEQVTVTYALYSRIQYFGLELRREPTTDGFWVEELEVPRGIAAYRQEVVAGVPYRVQTLKQQAVFPLRTGTLTIGPMVIDAVVGGGFFGRQQKYTRASKAVSVQIEAPPAAGRPPGFAEPNVGRFNLSGGVDRQQVQMGEAVKYRLHLDGVGNIKNVIMPDLPQGQGYRRFDPEPKVTTRVDGGQVAGTRILEYLLSPSEPGRFLIPAVVFHYFDPVARQYRTTTIPETAVNVIGAPGKGGGTVAPKPGEAAMVPGSDPDLRTIHSEIEPPPGPGFHRGAIFWVLLFAPPVLLALVVVFGRLRALRGELLVKNAPKRRAAGAVKRLREAERLLAANDAHRFFGEVASVLQTVVEVRLGQPIGSLTRAELEALLVSRGVGTDTAQGVVRELENCDFGRFAPESSRGDEMKGALARTRTLIDALDRAKVSAPEAA